jgi:hypothetical protein
MTFGTYYKIKVSKRKFMKPKALPEKASLTGEKKTDS